MFMLQVVMENYDVIWFELCHCHASGQEFCFFIVASGMDRAVLITNDIKTKIESSTGHFMILEEERHPESSYISRKHYGCPPFPKVGRERILQSGIVNLEATHLVSNSMDRRKSEGAPLFKAPNERRSTVATLLGKSSSPAPTPHPPPPLPCSLPLALPCHLSCPPGAPTKYPIWGPQENFEFGVLQRPLSAYGAQPRTTGTGTQL